MAMHAVVLVKPDAEVVQRIAENYPEYYSLSDTCFIVHTEDVTHTVAEKVDVKQYAETNEVAGLVFGLNRARTGLAMPDFWEWFAQLDARDAANL